MNRIVREHYPAAKLPTELREGIDPGSNVTATVEEEWARPATVMTLEEIFAARKPPFRSVEEIDRDLRRSRDE